MSTLAEELRALAETMHWTEITRDNAREKVDTFANETARLAARAEALEAAAQPPGLAGNFVRAYERNRELEAKLQREQSPEREAFVQAAVAHVRRTWSADDIAHPERIEWPHQSRELLIAYRAMLAAKEKEKR